MWWNRQSDVEKRAKELLKTMAPDEAIHYCIAKQFETKKEAAEISKRYRKEYFENKKKLDEWEKAANFISNSKQKPI